LGNLKDWNGKLFKRYYKFKISGTAQRGSFQTIGLAFARRDNFIFIFAELTKQLQVARLISQVVQMQD